jgi:hypothetical protein
LSYKTCQLSLLAELGPIPHNVMPDNGLTALPRLVGSHPGILRD